MGWWEWEAFGVLGVFDQFWKEDRKKNGNGWVLLVSCCCTVQSSCWKQEWRPVGHSASPPSTRRELESSILANCSCHGGLGMDDELEKLDCVFDKRIKWWRVAVDMSGNGSGVLSCFANCYASLWVTAPLTPDPFFLSFSKISKNPNLFISSSTILF